MTKTQTDETRIALINNNISFIQKDVEDIKQSLKEINGVFATTVALKEVAMETEARFARLEKNSITAEAFDPIKRVVYGLVTLIMLSVGGALIAVILK